ncbi:acetolactate synthase, large subunit, biosynthetic type [Halobacteroides halobius DSM 5150]|uniref:Acetolactate synthase n=1 Tax=Halobacteroides halobius (strain ATCC 35273 / DSM 5150 / MD-1) TaxID=748449 RepID=U3GL13_HALHC|nr:biosynthetic-type acetolactate synthase large subunit [Halobacteroides halobius]AGB40255.1 acetolactate synthase, large subunit, biosynthetic type [Halobacteroides halobius DSM 5150]
MAEMTGAKMFVESLYRENVETIFGYPGGAVLPIYDQLYDADFEHIMPHHEQGGVHAADGYARTTGKVGVCIATSGPGGTNLVTGLATAYMDSVPIVAFTGQVPSSMIGTDAFQEADITGITVPITKHNYLVQDVKELPRIIKEAFHLAQTGRPGPVLIDIPKDILNSKAEFNYPTEVNLPGYKPNYQGHELQVEEAAKAINEAKNPVIYAGGGVILSEASDKLRELSKKASIPVTTTLNGLGAVNERDDLSLGMLGMHGTTEANLAVSNTDLLITIGARFDDRVTGKLDTFAAEAKIIHIDIDPAEVGKRVEIDIPIVGDARRVLKELNPLIEARENKEWAKQIAEWRKLDDNRVEESNKLLPHQIIEEIDSLTNGEALITTEVGQHQMWAAQFYQFSKPRSFASSGGLGTMGYGFPAAIGVQAGNKDDIVFALAGDGSFQMNLQELATVAKNELPVNIVVFNNQYLGMVRQWQEMFYDKRYSAVCLKQQADCPPGCSSPSEDCPEMKPDFVKLAESFGIKAKRVTEVDEIRPALEEAINTSEPYLLDFIIEEEENVFPMVPPGGSLDKMVLKEDVE